MRGHGGPHGRALSQLVREASDHRGLRHLVRLARRGRPDRQPQQCAGSNRTMGGFTQFQSCRTVRSVAKGYPRKIWINTEGVKSLRNIRSLEWVMGRRLKREGQADESPAPSMLEDGDFIDAAPAALLGAPQMRPPSSPDQSERIRGTAYGRRRNDG